MRGDREKQNKKNAADQQKWLAAMLSGVPDRSRTCDVPLRSGPGAKIDSVFVSLKVLKNALFIGIFTMLHCHCFP